MVNKCFMRRYPAASDYSNLPAAATLFARRHLRQFVAAIVVGMGGVAFGPRPGGVVPGSGRFQMFPKVAIDHGLFLAGHPVSPLPVWHPFGDAVLQILGVRDHLYSARLFEGIQTFDGRRQLHAVVGGVRRKPIQLALVFVIAQNAGPTPAAGIAQTGTVGNDLDLLHRTYAATTSRLKNSSTNFRMRGASAA